MTCHLKASSRATRSCTQATRSCPQAAAERPGAHARPASPAVLTAALAAGWFGLASCGDTGGETPEGDSVSSTAPVAVSGFPLLDVSRERGIVLRLERVQGTDRFMPDSMAGGCALVDVDGDGDLDVFLAHGRWVDGAAAEDGLGRLLLQGSDGRFEDRSAASGVVGAHYGMGVASGDVNNDGYVDLYVTCFGPDQLLVNQGDGTFRSSGSAVACQRTAGWGASATFVDINADGWLDVAVSNYVDYSSQAASSDSREEADYPAPSNFDGTLDALLFGRGDGTFEDRSAAVGLDASGRGLGIAAGDWNGDGRVDLYVANDGQANHCWLQDDAGHFTNEALSMGLALSGTGSPEAGMGVARGDVNEDGLEDLLLTHLVQETHTLYLAKKERGTVRFRDRTTSAGIAGPSINMTGFGVALVDLNLDGHLDVVAAHGRVLKGRVEEGAAESPHWRKYAECDLLMLGDGTKFRPVPAGDFDARPETSRGLSVGDIDGDGDLDVLLTTAAGAVRLFEAKGPPLHHWVAVRAIDQGRDAIGASIKIRHSGGVAHGWIQTAHGYLSASEPVARFGLGAVGQLDDVEVRWIDGESERFDAPETDCVLTVRRGEGR